MKKIVLLALVSFVLLFPVVMTSSAQERIVGVTVGDSFKYGAFNVSWSSTDPNATFPPLDPSGERLKEMNETEWMLMSVQNISGGSVTFQVVKHFEDGTEKTGEGTISITYGVGHMPTYQYPMVISANLSADDAIYIMGHFLTWKINETVIRTYPDGARETNYLNITSKQSFILNITGVDHMIVNETICKFMNYYWDRSTGILVEYTSETIDQIGEYLTTWSVSYRIVESNVWTVTDFLSSTFTVLIFTVSAVLVFIAITAAIIIYKRRLFQKPSLPKKKGSIKTTSCGTFEK